MVCGGSAGSRERRPYSSERLRASLYSSGDQRVLSLKNLKVFIEEIFEAKFKHDQDVSIPQETME